MLIGCLEKKKRLALLSRGWKIKVAFYCCWQRGKHTNTSLQFNSGWTSFDEDGFCFHSWTDRTVWRSLMTSTLVNVRMNMCHTRRINLLIIRSLRRAETRIPAELPASAPGCITCAVLPWLTHHHGNRRSHRVPVSIREIRAGPQASGEPTKTTVSFHLSRCSRATGRNAWTLKPGCDCGWRKSVLRYRNDLESFSDFDAG